MFSQLIVNGLAVGSIYALIALAMVIIYKTSEVPNFAQGEMAMLSTYIAYTLLAITGVSFVWALLGALVFAWALGGLIEFAFLRRAKEPNVLDMIIITLGCQLMLYGLAGWKWGAQQRTFALPLSESEVIEIGPIIISQLSAGTIGVTIILVLVLFAFFRFTKWGVAMKATQQNPAAARANGIRTNRVMSVTFGISSVVGALAAMLIAPITTLDPNLMWDPLLKGFAAAVLGGMTTLLGAVMGGYLLGIVENLFGAYISLEFKSAVAFLLIVVVLWFKPAGLFGRHYERKV